MMKTNLNGDTDDKTNGNREANEKEKVQRKRSSLTDKMKKFEGKKFRGKNHENSYEEESKKGSEKQKKKD